MAETGNKRTDISEADLRQAINDIKNWFKENHSEFYEKANYNCDAKPAADISGYLAGVYAPE